MPGCSARSPARSRWPAPRSSMPASIRMTNGMALDTFWIQDAAGGTFDAPHRLARALGADRAGAVGPHPAGGGNPQGVEDAAGPQRMRAIHVPPRVVIDNHASNTHTVLEVNGRDRPGPAARRDRGDQRAGAADRLGARHHLRRARGGRVLREGRVRPEGGERTQAARNCARRCWRRWPTRTRSRPRCWRRASAGAPPADPPGAASLGSTHGRLATPRGNAGHDIIPITA